MKELSATKTFAICALAVCFNIVFGTFIAYVRIPFLFLDVVGTIFIAANFKMYYGVLTAIVTSLVISVVSGPLFLPFIFVSITIAIITNLMAQKGFGYKRAFLTGLLLALLGSLVSAPIRLIMFGGFSNLITDFLILSLKASGLKMITAAYWGAVTDSIVDKTLSCLLVAWMMKRPVFKGYFNRHF